jgi:DNA-binding beta-propeller fold protein YncE
MNRATPRPLAVAALLGGVLFALGPAPVAAQIGFLLAHIRDFGQALDLALDDAWQIVVAPNGEYAYISATDDNRVTIVAIDPLTGGVEQRRNAGVDVPSPAGLAVSPDSKFVYVASFGDDSVSVFSALDTLTGPGLQLTNKVVNGLGPVTELDGPIALALSPDGAHLYVASQQSKSITTFARSATTGALTWVEHEKSGQGGVVGLDGVWSLAFSGDGRSLYGATPLTDYLVAFRREPATGALTFQTAYRDGLNGITTLDAVQTVVVRPGDDEVWVGGAERITVFRRGPTGLLELEDAINYPSAEVTGLAFGSADHLAITTDNLLLGLRATSGSGEPLFAVVSGNAGVEGLIGLRSPVFGPDLAALHAVAKGGDSVISADTGLRRATFLGNGRFRIEATYAVGDEPPAAATPQRLTDDTTVFSFRSFPNKELVLKVLDGCGVNNRFWVFSSGLTNLGVVITVTDTLTGATKSYQNPQGTAYPPKLDTTAFATCS